MRFRKLRRTAAPTRARRLSLCLEPLETRDLLSGTPASVVLAGPELQTHSVGDAAQQLPRVSVAPDGTTLEVWVRALETDNPAEKRALPGVLAQFFDPSGQEIGGEQIVSEASDNFTSVAVDNDAQ